MIASRPDRARAGVDGGPAGRPPRSGLLAPLTVTVATFLLGYWQKQPCHVAGWPWQRELIFGRACYSDIPTLFQSRGLVEGVFPYSAQAWEHPLEYPVITGVVMDLTARASRWLAPGAELGAASRAYFDVNTVSLLGFALAVVWGTWALLRRTGGEPGFALLVAGAPTLVLAGTINWDLVAVAAAVLALAAWARDRPVLCGALIGLGAAAKLFPAFILGPLLVLCLRDRRLRAFVSTVGAAMIAWLAVNLPIMVWFPDGWLEFWRFNADRGADFGSLWYALAVQGHPVARVNLVAGAGFVLLCAAIGALAWWAPRPPTPVQLTFLVLAAFLMTNKVYSPQYVLWLLPFAVVALAEPVGRRAVLRRSVLWRSVLWRVALPFALWQAVEVAYWLAVWRYLAGTLAEEWYYPAAIYVRIAITGCLCVRVARDLLRPPAGATAMAGLYALPSSPGSAR